MIRSASNTGHSSDVRMALRVGNRVFEVGQVLPTMCIVRDPVETNPGPAELTITVDGNETIETVILRDGIRADSREVSFATY